MGFCSLASKAEDQIYLIGGFDDTGNKRRLESLNLDSMEWTRLADLNQNRSMAGCANFKGGSIVVAGGWGIGKTKKPALKKYEQSALNINCF